MATEAELNDLRERIGKLQLGEQLHLFELVLGDYRRNEAEKRAEIQAQNLAAEAELREWEQWHAEARRAAG